MAARFHCRLRAIMKAVADTEPRALFAAALFALSTGALSDDAGLARESAALSQHAGLAFAAGFDAGHAYLNAQAIYTLRFYQAIDVRELHLQAPEVGFAELRQIGEDRIDQVTLDGRRHRVTERRYAVFPFASGTLAASGVHAAGLVAVPGAAPGTRAPVRLDAPAATLDVLPVPPQAGTGPWLPARALTLSESWSPDPQEARVGQALVRTLRIEASGLDAAQLPELVPSGDGFSAHPGPPRLENRFDDVWNIGSREQDWRIVPARAGTLSVPEIRLDWWDTRSGERRTARLPGRTFEVADVLPSPLLTTESVDAANPDDEATPAQLPPEAADPVEEAGAADDVTGAGTPRAHAYPLIVSVLLLLLVLAAYLTWRYTRRPDQVSLRALRAACRRNDPCAARDALLAWAAASRACGRPQTLGKVLPFVPGPLSRCAIAELDRCLYGPAGQRWRGAQLARFPRS